MATVIKIDPRNWNSLLSALKSETALLAHFARHSCCAKVLLLSQKESNYILHYFSTLSPTLAKVSTNRFVNSEKGLILRKVFDSLQAFINT